jgi:ferritin-like metal-binding protein YciE
MPVNDLRDVLVECVRDLYSAETQLVKALPRMAKAATHTDLKAGFTAHLEETRGQVERLERVAELLGCKTKGKTCQAMKGLVEEGQEVIAETGDPTAKDALLISAAQKVEHYEIAGYGSARTFAAVLGEDEVAALLQETLDEEKATDEKLTAVAESGLNQAAADADGENAEPAPQAKKLAAKAKR